MAYSSDVFQRFGFGMPAVGKKQNNANAAKRAQSIGTKPPGDFGKFNTGSPSPMDSTAKLGTSLPKQQDTNTPATPPTPSEAVANAEQDNSASGDSAGGGSGSTEGTGAGDSATAGQPGGGGSKKADLGEQTQQQSEDASCGAHSVFNTRSNRDGGDPQELVQKARDIGGDPDGGGMTDGQIAELMAADGVKDAQTTQDTGKDQIAEKAKSGDRQVALVEGHAIGIAGVDGNGEPVFKDSGSGQTMSYDDVVAQYGELQGVVSGKDSGK